MAISNCSFVPTSENPCGFCWRQFAALVSVWCVLAELSCSAFLSPPKADRRRHHATINILDRCASLFELPNSIKIISLEKLTRFPFSREIKYDKILPENSAKITN